jgi:hypothetical protein
LEVSDIEQRAGNARRNILRYARSFPPGPERNQHRQIALSLRALFKKEDWLEARVLNDSG